MFANRTTTNRTTTNRTTTRTSTSRRSMIASSLGLGIAAISISACGGSLSPTALTPSTTVAPPTTVPAPPPTITTPVTTVPAPTIPPTTLPAPTIPVPPTTAAPAAPTGSLDLGDGVHVAVAPGWSGESSDGLVILTDGNIAVALMVVKRAAGENPKAVVDGYVELILDPQGVVDYSPATLRWTTESPRAAMQYELFYSLVNGSGESVQGGLSTYVRDDGLTLLYDVWAPSGVTGALPDSSFQSMIDSFLGAPLVATPVALSPVPEFQVTTIHP